VATILGGPFVLNQLGVLFACLCALGGVALLYQGFSIPDARPWSCWAARAFLPPGVALFRLVLKTWLELKTYRRG
jgi:hypothetical protein